jgi:phosphatidylglycerophosphate synthase
MLKLYREYKSSLKDIAVEEAVDLYIFRPIAFLIVKAIYRLPITPNQISVLSMTVGIAAGIFFAFGSHESFVYGALLYLLAHVLDCCDGMIARLKKCGTPIGRIVDGWTDYVVGVAVYVGFSIGLGNSTISLPMAPFAIMIPAGVSLIIHSMMVDYYRHEFLAHGLGKTSSIEDDRRTFENYLKKLKKEKRNYLEILLITFYLGYTGIQTKKEKKKKEYPQDLYYHSNRRLVFLWNWIGAATHIFMFILSAILYEPFIFFVYTLGVSNIWMIGMIVIQVRTNRRIIAKVN